MLSLVGAGPGDPELITLKAIRIIAAADVILYDALVNEELLAYASTNAIKKFVGKRYGCHSISQHEINRLIIEYARSHGHVVRLKGGDPLYLEGQWKKLTLPKGRDIGRSNSWYIKRSGSSGLSNDSADV